MRETEYSLESEAQLSDRKISEKQAAEFLQILGSRERGKLSKGDYQLHLPQVEEVVMRMINEGVGDDTDSRERHDEQIQEMRKSITSVLSPMYQNNELIGFPDDQVYLAKNLKYHEALKGYLQMGAREDVIPTEHATARLVIEKIAAEMEKTPRGKLMKLYALLNHEMK
ncbi:MAG: hypothetical protein UY65_C0004G0013 [Parcubacteria group bacterium GW2011_GWA2_51_12]|nr:MAG: hypothetical protein UY65_C0004G0013 [Parcubacteria group bacterium GW2011_GWA2_51_12]